MEAQLEQRQGEAVELDRRQQRLEAELAMEAMESARNKKRKGDNELQACEACEKKDEVIDIKTKQLELNRMELEQKTNQLEALTSQLEERVKCPVCLDVPTTGPIYSCPNGHSICSTCYKGQNSKCPMCRTKMNKNTSLLAVTVIENIEHACKFEGCEVRTPLAGVEEHRRSCNFKVVACPAIECKAKVAYNQVMDHLVNTCEHSFPILDVTDEAAAHMIYDNETEIICKSDMNMSTFSVDGKFFFLIQNLKDRKFKNIYMQMLGSKEDCMKYKVNISMKDENNSVNFGGHPYPIDMVEEEREDAGLIIKETVMLKFCTPVGGNTGRSKYKIDLEFIVLK
jgi:E3 ubiquitin-protein ligase SIAH1